MNYKLDFVRIDQNNIISGVGTAGNIWIVLNALLNIDKSDSIYVDMTVCPTINTEVEAVHGSMNPWEYYFNQINKPVSFFSIDSVSLPSKISYYKRYAHDSRISKALKNLFFERFSLKNEIEDEINSFYNSFIVDKYTLGVQIRLTDMAHVHNVKLLDNYILKLKSIIKSDKQIKQIFVATDDFEVLERLTKEIELDIVYLPEIYRATKDKPDLEPYDRYNFKRPMHRYKLGKEVIMDIMLLSKCNQILKADVSCVSQLAVFFSQNIVKTHFLDSAFYYYSQKLVRRILR